MAEKQTTVLKVKIMNVEYEIPRTQRGHTQFKEKYSLHFSDSENLRAVMSNE